VNHWWEIPLDILGLLLLAMMFGWAFDVYDGMAWKRLVRAQTGIGKMERGVKAGFFALATPHVVGNFFIAPFYFLSTQHHGRAAMGLSFYSVLIIPLIGLLLAKLTVPRFEKESKPG
jgi:small neutral amino acid transporter SnatA (MarC family)